MKDSKNFFTFFSAKSDFAQMPKVTPRVCWHTFCSNVTKSGMTPKSLQYLIGHSDIGVTMNIYTHLDFEVTQEKFKRIANGE